MLPDYIQYLKDEIKKCEQGAVRAISGREYDYFKATQGYLERALAKYMELIEARYPQVGMVVYDAGNTLQSGKVVDIERKNGVPFRWGIVWHEDEEKYPNPPAYLLKRREFKLSVDED